MLRKLLSARTPAIFHKVEGALVRAAFEQCGQNQVQAARLLGTTRACDGQAVRGPGRAYLALTDINVAYDRS